MLKKTTCRLLFLVAPVVVQQMRVSGKLMETSEMWVVGWDGREERNYGPHAEACARHLRETLAIKRRRRRRRRRRFKERTDVT